MTLVELIVERGEEAVDALPKGFREHPEAMAETIENNVRRLIIDEMAANPTYYEKMSALLDALIQMRKQQAMDYKAYLAKIVELTKQVSKPETQSSYPASIDSPARRALYDNLKPHAETAVRENPTAYAGFLPEDATVRLALDVDDAIRRVKKANWRAHVLPLEHIERLCDNTNDVWSAATGTVGTCEIGLCVP